MNTIKAIVWLFPVIFMLHDFEEIIFVEAWKKKYDKQIQTTKMKNVPFSDLGNTASFSIGIAIEFLIFSALSLFACIFDWYFLWFGLFFGFTLHLIVHCIMTIQFKHYVPGVVTGIPFLPICIYVLWISGGLVPFGATQLVLSCIIGSLLMLLMVSVLHRYMESFERLVRKFEV